MEEGAGYTYEIYGLPASTISNVTIAAAYVLLVVFSRLYVGAHSVADILGGFGCGFIGERRSPISSTPTRPGTIKIPKFYWMAKRQAPLITALNFRSADSG